MEYPGRSRRNVRRSVAFSLVTEVTIAFDKLSPGKGRACGTHPFPSGLRSGGPPDAQNRAIRLHRCALHSGESTRCGPRDGALHKQLGHEELSAQTIVPEGLFQVRCWPLAEQLIVQGVPSQLTPVSQSALGALHKEHPVVVQLGDG